MLHYWSAFLALNVLQVKVLRIQSFTQHSFSYTQHTTTKQHSYAQVGCQNSAFHLRSCSQKSIFGFPLLMVKEGNEIKSSDEYTYVKADDNEALRALFEKQCDQDGLMTKKSLVSIPMIEELLVSFIAFYLYF